MNKGTGSARKWVQADYVYDVFVSYRWVEPDRTWVREQLVPALRKAGLRVCVDQHDFLPGRDLILELARAGRESRQAICVLSPDYFEGNRLAHFESLMLRHRHPAGIEGQFIPLILRSCGLPAWLSELIPVDWTCAERFEVEWQKLLWALKAPNREGAPPCGAGQPAVSDMASRGFVAFDVVESRRRIEAAREPGKAAEVMSEIAAELTRCEDPTDRYWMYVTLGAIGGPAAANAIERGLGDPNPFAREGAKDALAKLSGASAAGAGEGSETQPTEMRARK